MIGVREFNYYQFLAMNPKTQFPPITCMNDIEHGNVFANIDANNTMYLYCIACDYRLIPGSTFSQVLEDRMFNFLEKIHESE